MNKLTYLLGIVCLFLFISCKPEPLEEEKDALFEGTISCLSQDGLAGVAMKVVLDGDIVHELVTDENGYFSFQSDSNINCYSIQLEKTSEKVPTPTPDDIAILEAFIASPSALPLEIYDINRDGSVDNTDKEIAEGYIADFNASPDFPWTFIQENGNNDFSCLVAADFAQPLNIIAYRLGDFDGSGCE